MSMSNGTGLTAADVAAVVDNNRGTYANDGFGFGGGNAWWIIILLLFGWGNRGGYGNNSGGTDWLPYIMSNNTDGDVQRGFDQAALTNGISNLSTSICNGFSGVNQALCSGFAGVNATVNSAANSAEVSNNARQMASMQQLFGLQTGLSNQLNNISMAQQNCCCENRAAIADVKYAIATENCADRAAVSDGVRDIMAQQTANTQALVNSTNAGFQGLMDKICQLELDAKNDKIADLQNKLTMANLAASQSAQTAAINANIEAQTSALENYLNPPARPAYIVQNPNCCAQNYYSGCGCGLN